MSYLFFKEDYEALSARINEMLARNRTERKIAADAVREGSSSQDGSAQRIANEQHRIVEGQLHDMQIWFNHAEVVEPRPFDGSARMGSIVVLKDVATDQYNWYCISSFWVPKQGTGTQDDPLSVSYATPLAHAMMGKIAGHVVEYSVRNRMVRYVVTDVLEGPHKPSVAGVLAFPAPARSNAA